jgi:hypothetical protein
MLWDALGKVDGLGVKVSWPVGRMLLSDLKEARAFPCISWQHLSFLGAFATSADPLLNNSGGPGACGLGGVA